MKIRIQDFNYEIPNDSVVVGVITESKKEVSVHVRPGNKVHSWMDGKK